MYTMPGLYGFQDCLKPVSQQQIEACKDEVTLKERYPCDETVFQLACFIMNENNIDKPTDPDSAIELYTFLHTTIRNNL